MAGIELTLSDSVQLLALLGVVLALIATLIGVLTIVRSTLRVTFGRGTLVLPFGDTDQGPAISEILAEQLDEVEQEWQRLSLAVKKEEGLVRSHATLVDLGPRARALSDRSLDEHENQFISAQPLAGEAMGPIEFAGVSVSPETIFSLFYRLRGSVARRTVRGSLHVNAINETGMVHLAMASAARDAGRDDVATLIAEGERWNQRALAVLPATSTHEREIVTKKFEDARSQYGL